MAVYKVPQDVEAEDKLIGPFSFRQFIYLIIAVAGIALAWGLAQVFIPLFIIPLPVILFFGVLSLPLRKDQPMEIYLAALVNFYLKKHKHIWDPAPPNTNIIITAPKVEEVQRTKGLSDDEVNRRLGYLSQVVDTHGWSTRGVTGPMQNSSMNDDLYYEAQNTQDVMDEQGAVGNEFNARLQQANEMHRQQMLEALHNSQLTQQASAAAPQIVPPQTNTTQQAQNGVTDEPHLTMNPYPSSMHQSVIQPASAQPKSQPVSTQKAAPEPQAESTSETTVSPDIIELANNNDISVETMARQAKRLETKKQGEEVVISLH